MPELSRFGNIKIRMYPDHNPPHFHADHPDGSAVFDIRTLEHTEGRMPRRQRNQVLQWAQLHQAELLEAWEMLQNDRIPPKIEPLP